jgi:outer membrane receptor protein involved in Fe transport
LSEWAVFGQVDYHILPSFDLELGGRWSGNAQHSTSGFNCCLLYGPAVTQPTIFSNDHDALYSVAPRWRPTDDTMIYGRIATGYRPGGPNIPIPGVTGLPATYGPDRTVNYEIGIRQDFFDKTVSADVTGYYINWKSVQILSLVDTPSGPVGVNGNAGSAVSKGVEWDLAWSPLRGLRIEAVGGYTDARLAVNAPGLGGQRRLSRFRVRHLELHGRALYKLCTGRQRDRVACSATRI